MKITRRQLKRIIREELLHEVSGAAGPGTVPGYDYIEISEYRGKPAHMINVKNFTRVLMDLVDMTAWDEFVDQGDIASVVSSWPSRQEHMRQIVHAGSVTVDQVADGIRIGCSGPMPCRPQILTLVDLGLCDGVRAYLIPGLSVDSETPIIVYGDIHSKYPTSLENVRRDVEDNIDQGARKPEEWRRWLATQRDVADSLDGDSYYIDDFSWDDAGLPTMHGASYRQTLVVLPRSSLIEDIDPCAVAKNYQLLREPPPPPDTEDEVATDSASVEIDPPSQEIDIDSEIYDAPLEPYKSPFRTRMGKQD